MRTGNLSLTTLFSLQYNFLSMMLFLLRMMHNGVHIKEYKIYFYIFKFEEKDNKELK